MKRIACVCALALLILAASPLAADEPAPTAPAVAWGKIIPGEAGTGIITLDITDWPADGKLKLPTPFANITQAYLADDPQRKPIVVEYNADATSIVVHLPETKPKNSLGQVRLETAEKSEQFADGRIVLSALDAKIGADRPPVQPIAKLISYPGHHYIDFPSATEETPYWWYIATRPGTYDVEITYATSESAKARLFFNFNNKQILESPLLDTAGTNRFSTCKVGSICLHTTDKYYFHIVQLVPGFCLKAITLRPACEGKMPQQAEDGTITLHARDVTIQGVKVQYEPKPEKNTVGYWVNEKDWVYWNFTANKAGKYEVEILQGCGEGHGGSEVVLTIAGQKLPFTVEDTGHFQNFKPRTIGTVELKAGQQRMTVVPVKKAKAAIMDLRQVRLIPVKE